MNSEWKWNIRTLGQVFSTDVQDYFYRSIFPDAVRIMTILGQFKPPLLLTSDDFNQPSVPVTGSSVPGTVPSVTIPEVSWTAQQKEETDLLSDCPQIVTGITKRTTETDSLAFVLFLSPVFLNSIVLMYFGSSQIFYSTYNNCQIYEIYILCWMHRISQ
jgi:hypothetical protein